MNKLSEWLLVISLGAGILWVILLIASVVIPMLIWGGAVLFVTYILSKIFEK